MKIVNCLDIPVRLMNNGDGTLLARNEKLDTVMFFDEPIVLDMERFAEAEGNTCTTGALRVCEPRDLSQAIALTHYPDVVYIVSRAVAVYTATVLKRRRDFVYPSQGSQVNRAGELVVIRLEQPY